MLLLPLMLSACVAIAYAQETLAEENRRLIEQQMERLNNYAILHQQEVDALKEGVILRASSLSRRLDTIEKYLFWLIVSVLGTAGVVGVDKAGYHIKKRSES